MTDEERKARNWLGRAVGKSERDGSESDNEHRATILSLLNEPRMPKPEDVPDEVYKTMAKAMFATNSVLDVYRALFDHYTKPPAPNRVEMWAVYGDDLPRPLIAVLENKTVAEKCAAIHPDRRIVHLVEADAAGIKALEEAIGWALGVPSTGDGAAAESMRVILRRALGRPA